MRRGLGRLGVVAVALDVFLGLGAVGGGIALMLGPRGEILPLPVSALTGSPFSDYLVPGAILFTIVGVAPLIVAVATWRRSTIGPLLTLAVAAVLLLWLAVEIAIIGYSNQPPLQAFYIVFAVVIAIVGGAWWNQTRRDHPRAAAQPVDSPSTT